MDRRKSLNENISTGIAKWAKEREDRGESVVGDRPATYDDYLKAQRDLSSSFRNDKQVKFQVDDEYGNSERNGPDETKRSSAETKRELRNTAQLLRTASVRKRRSSAADCAAWECMVQELQIKLKKLDADGHFKDMGSLKIPWYTPPIQRQRWEDEHTLPIVNHGTLFFDLFFVGAVYNLAEMVISGTTAQDQDDSSDTLRLIIYFLGIFGSVFSTWENGVYYQSRYEVADYAHQGFELLRFLGVIVMVLFIRPISELRDPQNYASTFMLCLAFLFESLMQVALDLEVYFRAQGDREAIQNHTLTSMKSGSIPATATFALSTMIAAVFHFGSFDKPLNTGALWNVTDLPLTLTALGYLWNLGVQIAGALHTPTGVADIRETLVPYNIDFVIQRYSDWFLLLLGEVVMAMVETTESKTNYVVAIVGSLILIMLFSLKFESEPDNPHGHALWRNTKNAYAFRVLTEVMSMGMMALSVTFKILLAEGRYGLSESFCIFALTISLAWVLIPLELTLISHKGISRMWARLFRPNEDHTEVSIYWPLALITLLKMGVLASLLALPVLQDDANKAIVYSFLVVLVIALTRIVGWAFVFKEDKIKEMMTTAKRKFHSVHRVESSILRGSSFGESDKDLSIVDEESGSMSTISSHRRYQSDTYHATFDAVIFADYEGSIVSVNNVALKMFRYETKSDMIGKNVSMLVGGGHAEHHAGYMKRFRDRGSTLLFGKQRIVKARRSDGEEFKCLFGIQMAGNGKHVIGFIRDMDDFEDDHEMILPDLETKTQKQLKRVLDDESFDSIVVIDLEGNIMGVNSTFVKEFRYDDKEELEGLDIGIIMDSNYLAMHTRGLARYREMAKKDVHFHCKILGKQNLLPVLRKDGTQFKCIVAVTEIEDSDPQLLVGYIKNVESVLPYT